MDCSLPGSSVHGDSPGKNTGVSFHALLQRIFPIQGLNPGLLHCRWILYQLSYQGSPRLDQVELNAFQDESILSKAWYLSLGTIPLSSGSLQLVCPVHYLFFIYNECPPPLPKIWEVHFMFALRG